MRLASADMADRSRQSERSARAASSTSAFSCSFTLFNYSGLGKPSLQFADSEFVCGKLLSQPQQLVCGAAARQLPDYRRSTALV